MKPAIQITDRAKRYRANSETSDWPRVCMFCGSTKDLQVDHLDGYEENGEPENLLMLCRSCNQLKSAVFKKAGLGRRTVQFNPADAVARHKGFTILKDGPRYFTTAGPESSHSNLRNARAFIDVCKNPAKSALDWMGAVRSLRGESTKYTPLQAARVIRSTPISRRYQYLDRVMRANPSVPTYEAIRLRRLDARTRRARRRRGDHPRYPSIGSQRIRAKDRGRESAAGDGAAKRRGAFLIEYIILAAAFVAAFYAAARAESAHTELQQIKEHNLLLQKSIDTTVASICSIADDHGKAISDLGDCVRMLRLRG